MKRREFLLASGGGLAGALVPVLAFGESKPCPPESLAVSGGTGIHSACTASSSGVPAWFVNQPERTWTAIAASRDETLLYAFENPPQPPLNGAPFDITSAYTGACVDQDRGEYLMSANGGHDNYRGNEVYAVSIRSASPKWYRVCDRSPTQVVDPPVTTSASTVSTANNKNSQGHNPSGYAAMYRDGRMRAQHGWHSNVFANDRVWYPMQSSPAGIGYSSPHAWSFNRNFPGLATAPGQSPLAWANDVGPWKWLGTSNGGLTGDQDKGASFGTAPPAAYDPISGKIWFAHETAALRLWASLDARSERIQASVENVYASPSGGSWATVVYDPSGNDRWRFFVVNARDTSKLLVLNLKAENPHVPAAWTSVDVSNTDVIRGGLGAVYHAASKAILLYDASDILDGSLLKIDVPTKADGLFDSNVLKWSVSRVSPGPGSANPHTGVSTGGGNASGQYTWSKFNIIDDMGDGQSALVVCMDTTLPVYVYKLPRQGV